MDIGCGYGEFINQVKARKKFAVDLAPEYKKYLNKNVQFFSGSGSKIPQIKSNSIDEIFISNVFEHISRKEILRTIQEMKRVLKKKGKVLILQPNIRFIQYDYWMFFDHVTPIDDRALEETFGVYGFKLQTRYLKFLPYTTKSKLPKSETLIKLYLKLPFLWSFFGKQSFLVFSK